MRHCLKYQNIVKLCITFIFLFIGILRSLAYDSGIEQLLVRLDSMIDNEDVFVKAKMDKIAEIKRSGKRALNLEERYWSNRSLYDEYFVFDADSAMRYAMENLEIARTLGNRQWEYEWKINKSFTLSVMGLLNDAKEELSSINADDLSDANKVRFYGQLAYLYSHIGQLSDHRIIENEDYDHISHIYEDSIAAVIDHDNPLYLWYKASSQVDRKKIPDELISAIKASVDTCSFNSRTDAMNCYILSRLYERNGDKTNRMHYLILSGMSDVSVANRDIASLNELANVLLEDGDIERSYKYVNYSQKQALLLPNRIRAAYLAKTVSEVHGLHEKKLQDSQHNLTVVLGVLFVIVLTLVLLIIMYMHRSRQLRKSQKRLEDANLELTRNMEEITRNKSERDALIANLQDANKRNQEISMTLREANYVKEECIGAAFALCSQYIDRFDKYRKELLKLIKSEKWDKLKDELVTASYTNRELKDFHHNFDSLFLNIYPDFVSDFNKLLRPEEQITVQPGELNTELRIYALVRLGISDSVKIAALLHCSSQTVYNYRLKMRNKAIIPKETFADAVKSLGKYQH